MTNYFVSSADGNDTDDGTTMDAGAGGGVGAWATLEHALETAAVLDPGDILWVRRTHSEIPLSDIALNRDGTPTAPIMVKGWPRAADSSISSATWTNGDETVDLIVGLSMDTEQHVGRYITGPDGETYMIAWITDSNTIELTKEYAGATVTAAAGACTIHEDEDYDLAQAIDDSAWTIKKADYNADADDLPLLDWNGGVLNIACATDTCYQWDNLHFKNWADASGLFSMDRCKDFVVRGCFLEWSANVMSVNLYRSKMWYYRCVFEGSGAGTSQRCISMNSGVLAMFDCVIDNMGDNGIYGLGCSAYLDNVNIGHLRNCGDNCISMGYSADVVGKDVICDDTNGGPEVHADLASHGANPITIENYNRVLGAHKRFTTQGTITKLDVVAGSGDPYKRTGGADSVVEVLFNESSVSNMKPSPTKLTTEPIFDHEFEATTDSRRYRYYVQAEGAVAATELWIEVEYVSSFDDTTEYVIKKVTSDEGITIRGDETDWSQYIEVGGIKPAVGSTVRIKCYCSFYDATNKIYIDPLCEVTT